LQIPSDNAPFACEKFWITEADSLCRYFESLSHETKSRFGPHAFDKNGLLQFYQSNNNIDGFIVKDVFNEQIIAYTVLYKGMLPHDSNRLLQYQYKNLDNNCCTFAPSVADNWQGKGIGRLLFNHIYNHCKEEGIDKIILWGGVQSSNERAIRYYKRLGFIELGHFEYNGLNTDMLLLIA